MFVRSLQSQMILSTCTGILPPHVQPKDFTLNNWDFYRIYIEFIQKGVLKQMLNMKQLICVHPNTLPINGNKFTIWIETSFEHSSPSALWTMEECDSERRSVYSHQSFLRSEVFNDLDFPSAQSVGANRQQGLTWNPKLKSYIPALWHLGHVFVFQLRLGSGSLPVCTGVLSATLSAVTLTDSKWDVPACRRPKASIFHAANGSCVTHLRDMWPKVITVLSAATENHVALKKKLHARAKNKSRVSVVVHPGRRREEAFQEVLVAFDALLSRCDKRVACFLIAPQLIHHVSQEQLITPRRERLICPINTQLRLETSDGGKLRPKVRTSAPCQV